MRHHQIFTFIALLALVGCQSKKDATPQPAFRFAPPAHFGTRFVIPADNPITEAGFELGRMLFYDKQLSIDQSVSCASCHQQSKAFAVGRPFSRGAAGANTKRSSMSIVNLLWVTRFNWDGKANTIEEQALLALQSPTEMGISLSEAAQRLQNDSRYPAKFRAAFGTETITPDLIGKALAQFERMLISSNSRFDKIIKGEVRATAREQAAIDLFMTHPVPQINLRGGNCGDCHGSNLTTLNTFHNTGLDLIPKDLGLALITGRLSDQGRFRAPSLRNIALTAPYMHDGRFNTLEEVLDHYNEHIQPTTNLDPLIIEASNEVNGKTLALTPQEKQELLFFLNMLTDTDFINDPRFSNPFERR